MISDAKTQYNYRLSFLTMVLLGLLITQLTGCGSVPEQGPADMKQRALSFTPPPGNAYVYVIRPRHFGEDNVYVHVDLDLEKIGKLGKGFYLFAAVAPGKHGLQGSSLFSQGLFLGIKNVIGEPFKFTAEADKNYYFKVSLPLFNQDNVGPEVEQISETDGKAYVQSLKLGAATSFGSE